MGQARASARSGVCWVYAYVAVTGLQTVHALFLEIGKAPPARDDVDRDAELADGPEDAEASEDPPAAEVEPALSAPMARHPEPEPASVPPAPVAPSWMGRHAGASQNQGGWMNRRRW